jgi:UDP:flavonoid glycosyltransferase YjiC (YdhE family)
LHTSEHVCEQVVGTRGDVQPFLAVARELRRYGHRVRLATHDVYRKFVEDNGIEFYPLGGDPAILSEFVVRNRGILPGGGAKGLMNDIREQARLHACPAPELVPRLIT